MANGMILNMFDLEAVTRLTLPALADRLVREEVWAGTSWPEGEPALSRHILAHAGTYREEMLAVARRALGRDRLSVEDDVSAWATQALRIDRLTAVIDRQFDGGRASDARVMLRGRDGVLTFIREATVEAPPGLRGARVLVLEPLG